MPQRWIRAFPETELTRPRVVFDTGTVLSVLLFGSGRLSWFRRHWREEACVPLLCPETAQELMRVLNYPKFRLSQEEQLELLGDYLPYCESVFPITHCPLACRDVKYQSFLDLAHSGHAAILVSGDQDLLVLAGEAGFSIETPESYRQRFFSGSQ